MTRHKKVKLWEKYEASEKGLSRKGKECPRCGSGIFLAEHGNRLSCGRCGLSKLKEK